MALVKETLRKNIYDGFYRTFTNQAKNATDGHEQEDPDVIIKKITDEMATVVADAVDAYVKSGDISVGPINISVVSSTPGSIATVSPLQPAKMK